jgi:hypothetical protein
MRDYILSKWSILSIHSDGKMAERSKALASGASRVICVGSNPTLVNISLFAVAVQLLVFLRLFGICLSFWTPERPFTHPPSLQHPLPHLIIHNTSCFYSHVCCCCCAKKNLSSAMRHPYHDSPSTSRNSLRPEPPQRSEPPAAPSRALEKLDRISPAQPSLSGASLCPWRSTTVLAIGCIASGHCRRTGVERRVCE